MDNNVNGWKQLLTSVTKCSIRVDWHMAQWFHTKGSVEDTFIFLSLMSAVAKTKYQSHHVYPNIHFFA